MSLVKRVSIRAKTVVCLYWLQIIISGGGEIVFIGIGSKLPFQENASSVVEYIRKIHDVIVLISSLEITLHCYTTGKGRHIRWDLDVLILSFEMENSFLIEFRYFTVNFNLPLFSITSNLNSCLSLFKILASVWQSWNFTPAVLFSFEVSHLRHSLSKSMKASVKLRHFSTLLTKPQLNVSAFLDFLNTALTQYQHVKFSGHLGPELRRWIIKKASLKFF